MRCVTRGCTIAEDKNAIVRTEMINLNPAVGDDSYPTVNKFVCENVSYIALSNSSGGSFLNLFPNEGYYIAISHSAWNHTVTINEIKDGQAFALNTSSGFYWHENAGGIPYITPYSESGGNTAVAIGYYK